MKRGEIWWADLDQPRGSRPVLLLTRDNAYEIRTAITIATITRTIRGIQVEVPLGIEDGMAVRCVINLDDINTISKSMLTERITTLSEEKLQAAEKAIIFALDLRT